MAVADRSTTSRAASAVDAGVISDEHLGADLLTIARASIAKTLGRPHAEPEPHHPHLDDRGATFVTITYAATGELHGCIGSLEPRRSVLTDVRANAVAAAFLDPRSDPLADEEFDDIVIEVSLLGPLDPMLVASEEDAIARMRRDEGYVISWGPMRGVLLPQVWDRCADAATFLRYLKLKAGLPSDFWANDLHMQRFRLSKWREAPHVGVRAPVPREPARA
jgi:AmmeMemoRadiSam system protein A